MYLFVPNYVPLCSQLFSIFAIFQLVRPTWWISFLFFQKKSWNSNQPLHKCAPRGSMLSAPLKEADKMMRTVKAL